MNQTTPIITLPIAGLSCGSCSARLQRHLEQQPGIEQASVNLATARATLTTALPLTTLVAHVEQAGFTVPDEQTTLTIRGLSCAACVRRVETALSQLPGLRQVQVNLANATVQVRYIPENVDFAQMQQVVQSLGFELLPTSTATSPEGNLSVSAEVDVLDIMKNYLKSARI